jgi:hypothetical protein
MGFRTQRQNGVAGVLTVSCWGEPKRRGEQPIGWDTFRIAAGGKLRLGSGPAPVAACVFCNARLGRHGLPEVYFMILGHAVAKRKKARWQQICI